ncbi:MAG: aminoacyl-tRNA hydrolase [Anaerolineae bacterium]
MLIRWLERLIPSHSPRGGDVDWLVVGLGNPGARYDGTRHSVGREVIRRLSHRHEAPLDTSKFNALFGRGRIGDHRVVLALSLTYMNESGSAIAPLARYFRVPPERLVAVFDDMDLAVGRIRVRPGGGAGGNKGAASLIRDLGTEAFPRVRVGIGRPPAGWDAADWVLSRFSPADREVVDAAVAQAADAVRDIVVLGIEAAMNANNAGD